MRICPDCGFRNEVGGEFCEGCGADLVGSRPFDAQDAFDAHLLSDVVQALSLRTPSTLPAEGTTVADALASMKDRQMGSVIVMDGPHIRGIITEHDVLRLACETDRPPKDVPITEAMTPNPVVLRDDDVVAVAVHKMVLGRFRHIPLVDAQGRLDGIVSSRDILIHLHSLLSES